MVHSNRVKAKKIKEKKTTNMKEIVCFRSDECWDILRTTDYELYKK